MDGEDFRMVSIVVDDEKVELVEGEPGDLSFFVESDKSYEWEEFKKERCKDEKD
jgi:hypothetical protein